MMMTCGSAEQNAVARPETGSWETWIREDLQRIEQTQKQNNALLFLLAAALLIFLVAED